VIVEVSEEPLPTKDGGELRSGPLILFLLPALTAALEPDF